MDKHYRVVFVYPDGHIEEIQDQFAKGADALEYGNSLLAQVNSTEDVFQKGNYEDEFGEQKERSEPYFMIVEVKGKKFRMAYTSKGH
jgi:hypothetical protein